MTSTATNYSPLGSTRKKDEQLIEGVENPQRVGVEQMPSNHAIIARCLIVRNIAVPPQRLASRGPDLRWSSDLGEIPFVGDHRERIERVCRKAWYDWNSTGRRTRVAAICMGESIELSSSVSDRDISGESSRPGSLGNQPDDPDYFLAVAGIQSAKATSRT